MTATILLIVLFQLYWLQKLYKQEYDGLKRSTDIVFKESLYNIQVARFENDSLFKGHPPNDLFGKNVVRVLQVNKDSVMKRKGRSVMISMNEGRTTYSTDSIVTRDPVKKFMIRSDSGDQDLLRRITLPNGLADSLPIMLIDSAFSKALSKANISLDYKIHKQTAQNLNDSCAGAFCTSNIPVGFFDSVYYSASFYDPQMLLFNRIRTQCLLSLLLVTFTILSFVFIYRNLLAEKKLSDIKNEFISNITHELKTPIATVSVAIEAMKNFNALQNPERTREYLDIADNELQRLSLLVDKVLKLSMFEQQQIELKFETVDLHQLAKEVIKSMRIQFEKRNADIELVAEGLDFNVNGDRLHLTSMLYNLIDNSLKYTTDKPVIRIVTTQLEGAVKVLVTDNGIGIDPEYRSKIFEKFFRVPGGNMHNVKGYGLGLSYVAHIVSKHKGNVQVESEQGRGTSFIIQLPVNDQKTENALS